MEPESATFSVEEEKTQLKKYGNYDFHDSSVIEDILLLEKRRFPFHESMGMKFFEDHVLADKRIMTTIREMLGEAEDNEAPEPIALIHYQRQLCYPGHILLFTRGGPEPGLLSLQVHFWGGESEGTYRSGGHLFDAPARVNARKIREVKAEDYDALGIPGVSKRFPSGGKLLNDGRVGFEVVEGYLIIVAFARGKHADLWKPMKFPASIEQEVVALETTYGFKANCQYLQPV